VHENLGLQGPAFLGLGWTCVFIVWPL